MKGNKNRGGAKSKYSAAFRQMVAKDYLEGDLSYIEVAQKYGLGKRGIVASWVDKLRKNGELSLETPAIMTEAEKQTQRDLQKQVSELENKLEYERLRNLGLETLIDVAEEELEIDIRKKSGTKQSKN